MYCHSNHIIINDYAKRNSYPCKVADNSTIDNMYGTTMLLPEVEGDNINFSIINISPSCLGFLICFHCHVNQSIVYFRI